MREKKTHFYYREGRSFHTAWTPESHPNSLVLLGGGHGPADLTAEILPSSGSSKPFTSKRHLITCNVDDFSVDDTFALEHGGNGACGIPDGDTIIMTGGFGQNYVTRFVLELEVTGLEELLIYTTSNTFRYNTSGFVEELPQLPDIRRGHACLSFPTNGVRSKGRKSKPNLSNTGTCCRWWK